MVDGSKTFDENVVINTSVPIYTTISLTDLYTSTITVTDLYSATITVM